MGAIQDYDGLIEVCRARVPELGISYAILDQLAGWTDTYATKILGPRPLKRLSFDMLFVLLGALGLEMQIVPNAEATERLKNHKYFEHRKFMLSVGEHTPITVRFPRRHYRKISALAAQARLTKITPGKRSRIASKAAKARWERRQRLKATVAG